MVAIVLKILLDSNVLIPAYPKPGAVPESTASAARALLRFANEHGHTTYYHPGALHYDFANVKDPAEREWRRTITANHPGLPNPPGIHVQVATHCGNPPPGSNDWVDNHLLSAVVSNAVNLLVTEDSNLRKKAQRLQLGERVANIEDALAHLRAREPSPSTAPLLPQQAPAHTLNPNDAIFESLREDYPSFDGWLQKCQTEHRTCWTVEAGGSLAALTIVKWEDPPEFGPGGKTLKICLFKVSEQHPGMRYGELLLKSAFDYAYINRSDSTYVTVFPKYGQVSTFLENFGFVDAGARTGLGEIVMEKSLHPDQHVPHSLPALDYHLRYGTWYYATNVQRFIVPIEPRYHRILFPEADEAIPMRELGTWSPAGNGIQKAYLSLGSNRQIRPGDILYFYRSHDRHRIKVIGIVEDTAVSKCPEEISSYVGKRSVYSHDQIRELTQDGSREVLAILFRQARVLEAGVTNEQMKGAQVWRVPAQSIMKVKSTGSKWLESNIDLMVP